MNVLSSGVMVMNKTDKGAIFWNHKLQHKWKIFNKQLNGYVELWLTLREYTESIKGEFKKETHLFWLPVHLFPNKVTVVVQLLSCVWLLATSWTAALGFPDLHHLLEFAQTHVHWVIDAIQPSHCLSPASPPAFNLSQHQGLFQWVSFSHQVAKVLELQLRHQSFSEYSGLTSFRMDWLDLFAVQGTLKSLLQHHSLKASILRCSNLLYGPTLTSVHDYWKKPLL